MIRAFDAFSWLVGVPLVVLFAVVHLWPAAALLALLLVASRVNAWGASVRERIAFERVERWRANLVADEIAARAARRRVMPSHGER